MMIKKLPKLFQFVLASVMVTLAFLTIMRIVFWFIFRDPADGIPSAVTLESFYIGLKFDLRLALLIHVPLLFLAWIRPVHAVKTAAGRRLWCGYLTILSTFLLFFYFFDFGHYGYLETRINGTVLSFLYNPDISFEMIWESYPVIPGLIVLALFLLGYGALTAWIARGINRRGDFVLSTAGTLATLAVFGLLYLLGIYGKLSYYPLRWSDAFFTNNNFTTAVALNPVLYFFDTLKNREVKYDLEKVRTAYEKVAAYLGVQDPDRETLNFIRIENGRGGQAKRPNVVVVFLESFAYYKTSVSGNPLDPTPYFNEMAKNGILFSRFYTPQAGTAQSIFTTITGIPDVEQNMTSSRNPLVVRQHSIVNAFEGYEKFYFLGGSLNWAEIRGLLSHNIPGLKVYEEGSYTSPRADVWGISDLHLFEEANKVLREIKDKPFFAFIQTAGNHRPYTIPEDNRGFRSLSISENEAVNYGFESVAGFNAIRFMDHSIQFFVQAARQDGYADDTIFVFFGDHGSGRRHPAHMYKSEDQLQLTKFHVPLLIYAPGLIDVGRIDEKVASEVDVLPTVAGLADIPYVNSTLGRNLLDGRFAAARYAFTISHRQVPEIGLISDDFYFLTNADGTSGRLHALASDTPWENVMDVHPEVTAELAPLCLGLYEAACYIRYNNTPEMVAAKIPSENAFRMITTGR
jgi:phosphoglycerol transferase MdoB-like AlkP superfamily enzyme